MGLPSDKEQYIHRLGRTGRKGKEGQGILLLAPWEEFFLSTLEDLPISKVSSPLVDSDTKKKVCACLRLLVFCSILLFKFIFIPIRIIRVVLQF